MHSFEPWGIVFTFVGLMIALITIIVDLEDRQSERIFRAWQVVRGFEARDVQQIENSPGASGSSLRQSLEFLNRDFDGFVCLTGIAWVSELLTGNNRRECFFPRKNRESLAGLTARAVALGGADLSDADLRGADFTDAILAGTTLWRADLRGADLRGTNPFGFQPDFANLAGVDLTGGDLRVAGLTGVNLTDAKLTNTDLTGARLVGANLSGADLRGADLTAANLRGADLNQATNLTQAQLDAACADELPGSNSSVPVHIPAGLIWRSKRCPSLKRKAAILERSLQDRPSEFSPEPSWDRPPIPRVDPLAGE